MGQPNIEPNSSGARGNAISRHALTGERDVPFAGAGAAHAARLDVPLNGPVQHGFDGADLRDDDRPLIGVQLESRLRIAERIVSPLPTEPWVARLFAGLDPTKERLHRQIEPHGNVLQDLTVDGCQRGSASFQGGEGCLLVVQTQRLPSVIPCRLPLVEQMVVQPPAFVKRDLHEADLPLRWKQSVLKGLTHEIDYSTNRASQGGF